VKGTIEAFALARSTDDAGNMRFRDQSGYRQADFGYRPEFGSRDRYRTEFRSGFESGYRTAFARYSRDDGRFDAARRNGFDDGYEAGVKDARDRNRFDPISERRYRNADHGYKREYGAEDRYKAVYRDAFRDGYEQGYWLRNNDYRRG